MAYNGTTSSETTAGRAEPQHLAYRPPGPQQQQQRSGQHPGPAHSSGVPQHHYQTGGMNTDMAPAPLRVQRKPVPGAGKLHATQTHIKPWQPAPPAVYHEMEAPPISSAPNTATMVPAEPEQPVQTFIAELQGSEHPEHSQIISPNPSITQAPQPASIADEKPEPVGNAQATAAAEASSFAGSDSDLPSQPRADGSKPAVEPPQSPLRDVTPPGPAPAAVPDSEGLIVVEKPVTPDHEGLIPLHTAEAPPPKSPLRDVITRPGSAPAAVDSEGLIVVEKPGPPDHEGLIPLHGAAAPPLPSASLNPHQHNFSAPSPQPPRTDKHSSASTSLGGFANSVFSKDTVNWSKKTASRFGGAIKTAASTAHAAATNAQSAASQAAILHKQRLAAAATNAQSSAEQAAVWHKQRLVSAAQRTASSIVPANANGPATRPVTPQPPNAHTWPGPPSSATPTPSAPVGQPTICVQPATPLGPGGPVHSPP